MKNDSLSYKKNVKQPSISEKNTLNHLNSKEWVEFTKSWFIESPSPRAKGVILHPAKYPESLVEKFLLFFTQNDGVIFDPFLGTGSSLVAVDNLNKSVLGSNRKGFGTELNPEYAKIASDRTEQTVYNKNCFDLNIDEIPDLDFIITSPPYWNVLHKDSGHINKKREKMGLDVVYSDDESDLGNIDDYDEFIKVLSDFFSKISIKLKDKKFCVVVLSCTNRKGRFYPIPYDFAGELQKKCKLVLKGEKIWCQDNKALMPYGYPYSFVPNFTHHTCLIFRKEN
ncbi:DNA methyltransferase [Gallibacterium melopsittaci]|uniref:Methyltransferase n=1 Tax=Gallibacterium melopsittaci TaxID=516063 RepID=A0ABV6HWH4_9PAST